MNFKHQTRIQISNKPQFILSSHCYVSHPWKSLIPTFLNNLQISYLQTKTFTCWLASWLNQSKAHLNEQRDHNIWSSRISTLYHVDADVSLRWRNLIQLILLVHKTINHRRSINLCILVFDPFMMSSSFFQLVIIFKFNITNLSTLCELNINSTVKTNLNYKRFI